jgi:hypothetical protein
MRSPLIKKIFYAIICFNIAACALKKQDRIIQGQIFNSSDEALNELEDVVASNSTEKARILFGPDGQDILSSGDPHVDTERRLKFIELFNQSHSFEKLSNGNLQLVIGDRKWPFPLPLVRSGNKWFFDAEAGREGILDREIGQNEISALRISRTIPLLQRQYAVRDWNGDGIFSYAKQLISTPGNKDGLYWNVGKDKIVSPLGPIIAEAASENNDINAEGKRKPYHGYRFKLLESQSTSPIINDIFSKPGRYWLVASPEERGVSGIMTFATNERGWIYEKDLGENRDFSQESGFNTDESWKRIE